MASPCVKTTRPCASSANSFSDLSGRFKREMLKHKRLFVQLNIILSWSGARREGEIQFSLSVHLCLWFFGWHFYVEPKTRETTSFNRVLSKDDIVEYNMFSLSLTGIVKCPLFKRWICSQRVDATSGSFELPLWILTRGASRGLIDWTNERTNEWASEVRKCFLTVAMKLSRV